MRIKSAFYPANKKFDPDVETGAHRKSLVLSIQFSRPASAKSLATFFLHRERVRAHQ
jgi:hypothetical protein